jgi:hypothetical protein
LTAHQEHKGVVQDKRHRALLQFIRKIVDVPLGYSKNDLLTFRSLAARDYPALTALVEQYLRLADRSETDVLPVGSPRRGKSSRKTEAQQMHLFDLLREKRLFSSNADLAEFAARILPKMRSYRFDKMSRGDIAARIIEYLETRDPRTRKDLEESMRNAMDSGVVKPVDKRSFFSEWEKIIKGIQF